MFFCASRVTNLLRFVLFRSKVISYLLRPSPTFSNLPLPSSAFSNFLWPSLTFSNFLKLPRNSVKQTARNSATKCEHKSVKTNVKQMQSLGRKVESVPYRAYHHDVTKHIAVLLLRLFHNSLSSSTCRFVLFHGVPCGPGVRSQKVRRSSRKFEEIRES